MTDRSLFPVITGSGFFHAADEKDTLLAEHGLVSPASLDEALSAHFPKGSLRRVPLYARTGLYAAVSALSEAKRFPCPENTGIVVGSFFGCQKTSFDFMDSILNDGPRLSSPLAFSHAVSNMAAGLLSLLLHTTGPAFTVNDQELSFAGALEIGLSLLNSARCDSVLVGALDEADPRLHEVFPALPMASGSFFVCLERRSQGIRAEVQWDVQNPSSLVLVHGPSGTLPLSPGVPQNSALAQAFGCALALAHLKRDAVSADISQKSTRVRRSALIRLEKLS
ncbi:beta-ketoacyl synthase N-terminal-like domain-containing protein [uncultured Mailhella sp.]|uniref:beta-ketoacyl synthase chain length factor n=1 Tax=uncultured Mailhella sp. TaxID=1981031 RepID=UPI00261D5938|nr:beta-ketoacyl synthase N-terminal-like domain-containing protein [uncultured Mailhella sp.]